MRNKIIITVTILFACYTQVLAMAYVPRNNSLQPMPAGIAPNISQNVNATSSYDTNYEYTPDFSIEPDQNNQVDNVSITKDQPSHLWYWVVFGILITIVLSLGFSRLYPSQNK